MIYYLTFFTLLFWGLMEIVGIGRKIKGTKILWWLISLFLILFSGLRYEVGTDYVTYYRLYQAIRYGLAEYHGFSERLEPLSTLIIKYSPYFWMVLLIFSIISISFKTFFLYKEAQYPLYSLFLYYSLYFLTYDMGIMRQAVAMAIVLMSCKYIFERDLKKYLISIVIASGFHYSAILFLPAFWLANIHVSKKKMICISLVCVLFAYTNIVNSLLVIVIDYLPRIFSSNYNQYLNMSSEFEANDFLRLVIFYCFLAVLEINDRKMDHRQEHYLHNNGAKMLNIYFFGICIYYAAMSIHFLSSRGSVYYTVMEVFLWPLLVKRFKGIQFKIIFYVLIAIYCFYYFYNSIHMYSNIDFWNAPLLPYKWVIN